MIYVIGGGVNSSIIVSTVERYHITNESGLH
ncbi:hypothetical protein [Paenibacillus xylanilyticus]